MREYHPSTFVKDAEQPINVETSLCPFPAPKGREVSTWPCLSWQLTTSSPVRDFCRSFMLLKCATCQVRKK